MTYSMVMGILFETHCCFFTGMLVETWKLVCIFVMLTVKGNMIDADIVDCSMHQVKEWTV